MNRYLLSFLLGFTAMLGALGTAAVIGGVLSLNADYSGEVASCMKQGNPRSQCP